MYTQYQIRSLTQHDCVDPWLAPTPCVQQPRRKNLMFRKIPVAYSSAVRAGMSKMFNPSLLVAFKTKHQAVYKPNHDIQLRNCGADEGEPGRALGNTCEIDELDTASTTLHDAANNTNASSKQRSLPLPKQFPHTSTRATESRNDSDGMPLGYRGGGTAVVYTEISTGLTETDLPGSYFVILTEPVQAHGCMLVMVAAAMPSNANAKSDNNNAKTLSGTRDGRPAESLLLWLHPQGSHEGKHGHVKGRRFIVHRMACSRSSKTQLQQHIQEMVGRQRPATVARRK